MHTWNQTVKNNNIIFSFIEHTLSTLFTELFEYANIYDISYITKTRPRQVRQEYKAR